MLHRPAAEPVPPRGPARIGPSLLVALPVALLAALAGLALLPAAAHPAPPPASPGTVEDATAELLAVVNAERARYALPPLAAARPLAAVAGDRAAAAAAAGDLESPAAAATEITRQMRRAGYAPHAWRQRLVQGPPDATALVRHWRASDRDGFEEIALGDFHGFGAARVAHPDGPVWSLLFALPRLAWERRQAEPLADVEAVREGVLAAVNAERRAAGLPPVRVEPRLHVIATGHANDMARRGFFDHVTPEGSTPMDRVRQGGYPPHRVAENLAKGLFEPAEVVRRWMLSPGHRRNILDPRVREVGIAVVAREEGQEVLPLWVLVLAAPA